MPKEAFKRQLGMVPIPTEAFLELNPELEQFIAEKYPTGFFGPPIFYYKYSSNNNHSYNKTCAPYEICLPRPCYPVY